MRLGVGPFTCQRPPFDDRSMVQIYDDMLKLARAAETNGLDSVWVSEHHFVNDGYMSGPLASLSAIAGVTDEISLGTAVSLAPLHHPIRLAEDTATIDLVSGGRLIYGASIGYREIEFDAMNIPKNERTDRLEDAVRFLRAAWSSGALNYGSKFYDIDPDISITPKPSSVPPIALGGHAKPAVRRAATLGDGWIAPPTESPEGVRIRRKDIESVRENGLDGFTVYPGGRGFVADSREAAWEAIKEGLLHHRRKYADFGLYSAEGLSFGDSVDEIPKEVLEEVRENAIFGTPEDVISELESYRDAAGENSHFVFRVFIPGVEVEPLERCLELLGEEVKPHLE